MVQIGISDISKNPAIIDNLEDVAQILNKKTKQVKGIFIPNLYEDEFKKVLEEIEYRRFVERNRSLKHNETGDETLEDGLGEEY